MVIFIYGFPHSGTTILRKIIGEHPLVEDYLDEQSIPPPNDTGNLVYKMPILADHSHVDCKRIMIMKNPYDIFGSFYLRFGDEYLSYPGRMVSDYERFVEHFLITEDFTVKYEELGDRLPEIFDYLGLEFQGVKNKNGYISSRHKWIPREKPTHQVDGPDHAYYRQWQINQPFRDMTGESAKFLPQHCRGILDNSEIIKKLYD